MQGFLHFLVTDGLDYSVERHFQQYFSYIVAVYALFIEFYYALFFFVFFFIDMHYNIMIRTFCIMKKMTFTAFHYLNLSIRCEELHTHLNSLKNKIFKIKILSLASENT
jgi:hypothetical protein